MARTRVSPKYQIVIPKEIRDEVGLKPGQELRVVAKNGTITLIPDRAIAPLRGVVRGIRTTGFREKTDRL